MLIGILFYDMLCRSKKVTDKLLEPINNNTNRLNLYIKRNCYSYDNSDDYDIIKSLYPWYIHFDIDSIEYEINKTKYNNLLYENALDSKCVKTFSETGTHCFILAAFETKHDLNKYINKMNQYTFEPIEFKIITNISDIPEMYL